MSKKLLLNFFILFFVFGCGDSNKVFIFNPPDGFKYKEFVNMETVIRSNVVPDQNISILSLVNQVEVKKAAGVTTYDAFIQSALQTVNGLVIDNPIFGAMVGANIIYEVTSDGKISDIKGYGEVADKARLAMTSKMLEETKGMVSGEVLVRQEKKNWSERVESLIGRSAYIGYQWTEVKELTLPTGGKSKYYAAFKIEGSADCGGAKKCLLVSYSLHSNEKEVAESLDSVIPKESDREGSSAGSNNFTVTHVTISGKGARIVDPNTLVIYKDGSESKIEMVIAVRGGSTQTVESVTKTDYFIEVIH